MTQKKDPNEFKMSFSGHLEELRRRLIVCVIALLVGMAISYVFRDYLFTFILDPLFRARENVSEQLSQNDDDNNTNEPVDPTKLAEIAQRYSKQALSTDDPSKTARLAAQAASYAAKAVKASEMSVEERQRLARRRSQRSIAYTDPVKPFWVSLQLSLVGGICLAFGIILWEIWGFVAPGLYPKEKRYAVPFVVAATACFLGGAGFGYRYVFPLGFGFLTRFSREIAMSQNIEMMDVTTVDAFVAIALKLLLAFGLVFELPVVVSFLAMMGIVDHKQLWRFGRWFVVIAVVIGALLTPPDVISQIMMAIPMTVLYIISIGLAYILHPDRRKKKKRKQKAQPPEKDQSPEEQTSEDDQKP